MKGRAVLGGHNLRDAYGTKAEFEEVSMSPAAVEASRCADTYSLQPGFSCEVADADQAFLQIGAEGVDTSPKAVRTWISLPKWLQPPEWSHIDKPVVLMELNLYGHPNAQDHWWHHLHQVVVGLGFESAGEGWTSVYFHRGYKTMLIVYVDDLKLSGPSAVLPEVWEILRKHVRLGKVQEYGRFLGVHHQRYDLGDGHFQLVYDMTEFMRSVLARYEEAVGTKVVYRKAATPFLDEATLTDVECAELGELAPFAASVLMKSLWGARMARWDILRQVCYLAGFISKWTLGCDKMLYRLMCYINDTLDYVLTLTVSDPASAWELWFFADSDLAGCKLSKRSTSGSLVAIASSKSTTDLATTFCPLSGHSRKQTATSEATTEAELVSLSKGLSKSALPLLDLWELVLGRSVLLRAFEDNSAAITVTKTGYSQELRSLQRTHGVSIARLHEYFFGHLSSDGQITLEKEDTERMRADGFTKAFRSIPAWRSVIHMLGIRQRIGDKLVPVNP